MHQVFEFEMALNSDRIPRIAVSAIPRAAKVQMVSIEGMSNFLCSKILRSCLYGNQPAKPRGCDSSSGTAEIRVTIRWKHSNKSLPWLEKFLGSVDHDRIVYANFREQFLGLLCQIWAILMSFYILDNNCLHIPRIAWGNAVWLCSAGAVTRYRQKACIVEHAATKPHTAISSERSVRRTIICLFEFNPKNLVVW
jgi:hypothetical protein